MRRRAVPAISLLTLVVICICACHHRAQPAGPSAIWFVAGNQHRLLIAAEAAKELAATTDTPAKALYMVTKNSVVIFRTDGSQGAIAGKAGMAYQFLENQDFSKQGNEQYYATLGPVDLHKSDEEIAKQFGIIQPIVKTSAP